MRRPLLGAPQGIAVSPRTALRSPGEIEADAARHYPSRRVDMSEIDEIMAPLGATILGTRSLADAARVLEHSETAVVLNLSYRAIGLITRADLTRLQEQDPHGWPRKRCAGVVHPGDQPVQRSTSIRELLLNSRLDSTRPLLVLDHEEPAGIVHPEAISAWRAKAQPISGEPMKGSTHSPMNSRVR
ncbi:hypothetical protein [Nesterenkonia halotolerans]|uniref:CBS domain-containing protein n=2 Tax=Nesterenkonia halotolerans TaxID=225325 RepID=A0ABR9J4M1_9MICC|nr:hypothetical protein [Nesterenkonia halotolerans]MBE1513551.1 hypothetical protein [Nesterenkonia halotolerans]